MNVTLICASLCGNAASSRALPQSQASPYSGCTTTRHAAASRVG